MKARSCSTHAYSFDPVTGRRLTAGCVYCGQRAWVSRLLVAVGAGPRVKAPTAAQAANAAEWSRLNAAPAPQKSHAGGAA